MIKAANTSEMPVNFYQTTWRNNPAGSHLQMFLTSAYLENRYQKVRVLTDIDDAVVGEFPAGLEPQDTERITLFGGEITQSSIRDVVGLQGKLVE
jgi:hypothetical protein